MNQEIILKLIDIILSSEQKKDIDENVNDKLDLTGAYVLVRTYSAGIWAGNLAKKEKNEVCLTSARRLWRWQCKKSISLSGVAKYGIDYDESKIAPALDLVWVEATEIILLKSEIENNIKGAPTAKQD